MTTEPRVITTAPLVRRRADGNWERLVFGGLLVSPPRYEPCEVDYAAWVERQRKAQEKREKTEREAKV